MCVFLSTRRHPAHPVSVLILHILERYKLCGHKPTTQRYYIVPGNAVKGVDSRQCNVVPSYWIRQAQHTHGSNPDRLNDRKNKRRRNKEKDKKNEKKKKEDKYIEA